MNNPAFIIDGFTEKLILQQLCPGKPIVRIDMNGKRVTIEAMAKNIASKIRLKCKKNYPVIILVDKEDRDITCEEMISKLKMEIIKDGIKDIELLIAVADRMIENWIIADWKCLNTDKQKPKITDGVNGVSIIKKVRGSYNKTTDGVSLFMSFDPKCVYRNSTSFKFFVDILKEINCQFLNFDKQ